MSIDYSKISRENSAPPPSKEYMEGYSSYVQRHMYNNPYDKNTKEYDDWEHGWCDSEGYDDYINSVVYID